MTLLDLVVLSAVVYRLTRFALLDSMFEDTREQAWTGMQARQLEAEEGTFRRLFWRKLLDGSTCAFCVSVWAAGGATLFWAAATSYDLTWASIPHWLAVATGGLVFYRYIDPPDHEG